MANALGYLNETDNGFEGELAMATFTAPIRISKNTDKTSDAHPDFRIYAGSRNADIGAAWNRTSRATGRTYLSLTLADPLIGDRRIFANIAPVKGQDGRHVILWNPKS